MGQHLIVDAAAHRNLSSREAVQAFLLKAAALVDMEIIGLQIHVLPNGVPEGPGITGIAVITTSHLAAHTWPQESRFTFDLHSCLDFNPGLVLELLRETFSVERWHVRFLERDRVPEEDTYEN